MICVYILNVNRHPNADKRPTKKKRRSSFVQTGEKRNEMYLNRTKMDRRVLWGLAVLSFFFSIFPFSPSDCGVRTMNIDRPPMLRLGALSTICRVCFVVSNNIIILFDSSVKIGSGTLLECISVLSFRVVFFLFVVEILLLSTDSFVHGVLLKRE